MYYYYLPHHCHHIWPQAKKLLQTPKLIPWQKTISNMYWNWGNNRTLKYSYVPTPPKPVGLDPKNVLEFSFLKKKKLKKILEIFLEIFFGHLFGKFFLEIFMWKTGATSTQALLNACVVKCIGSIPYDVMQHRRPTAAFLGVLTWLSSMHRWRKPLSNIQGESSIYVNSRQ
jgi:hypothetical protein